MRRGRRRVLSGGEGEVGGVEGVVGDDFCGAEFSAQNDFHFVSGGIPCAADDARAGGKEHAGGGFGQFIDDALNVG